MDLQTPEVVEALKSGVFYAEAAQSLRYCAPIGGRATHELNKALRAQAMSQFMRAAALVGVEAQQWQNPQKAGTHGPQLPKKPEAQDAPAPGTTAKQKPGPKPRSATTDQKPQT